MAVAPDISTCLPQSRNLCYISELSFNIAGGGTGAGGGSYSSFVEITVETGVSIPNEGDPPQGQFLYSTILW